MLLKCFNHVLKGGETAALWETGHNIRYTKGGKREDQCSSYRPISVLNIGCRLFASIIAIRLENIIPDSIDWIKLDLLKIGIHRIT